MWKKDFEVKELSVEEIILNLQSILDLWDVTYDGMDEKYIAKISSSVVLNSEQIEWIAKMGLHIFTVQKYEDVLIVKFSAGVCC